MFVLAGMIPPFKSKNVENNQHPTPTSYKIHLGTKFCKIIKFLIKLPNCHSIWAESAKYGTTEFYGQFAYVEPLNRESHT